MMESYLETRGKAKIDLSKYENGSYVECQRGQEQIRSANCLYERTDPVLAQCERVDNEGVPGNSIKIESDVDNLNSAIKYNETSSTCTTKAKSVSYQCQPTWEKAASCLSSELEIEWDGSDSETSEGDDGDLVKCGDILSNEDEIVFDEMCGKVKTEADANEASVKTFIQSGNSQYSAYNIRAESDMEDLDLVVHIKPIDAWNEAAQLGLESGSCDINDERMIDTMYHFKDEPIKVEGVEPQQEVSQEDKALSMINEHACDLPVLITPTQMWGDRVTVKDEQEWSLPVPLKCEDASNEQGAIDEIHVYPYVTFEEPVEIKVEPDQDSQDNTYRSSDNPLPTYRFQCKECGRKCLDASHFKEHMNIHTGKKVYACDKCDKKFACESAMKRHKKFHTMPLVKFFECSACPETCVNKQHNRKSWYKCLTCGMKFTIMRLFRKHDCKQTTYICEMCKAKFRSSSELLSHKKIHADIEQNGYMTCRAHFESTSSVSCVNNIRTRAAVFLGRKAKEINLSCHICSMKFRNIASLRQHIKSHNEKNSSFVSGQNVSLPLSLKTHKQVRTTNKLYECDICGKNFPRSYNRKIHMQRHGGIKPYRCEVCGTSFHELSYLRSHKKTHTRNKELKCVACGECFSSLPELNLHVKIHS